MINLAIFNKHGMPLGSIFKIVYAKAVLTAFAVALLTTVAGINISVLLLLFAAPWFWKDFKFLEEEKQSIFKLFGLIVVFCLWDILTNLVAGADWGKSLLAMQHDLRPFVFIVLLWPLFADERLARFALWALIAAFVVIAGVNLVATVFGYVPPGKYLWLTMHHLHGQMSVGVLFLLAQMLLTQHKSSWRLILPLGVLVVSMFVANERRAGYFLLIAALPLWIYLNREKFSVQQYRWWLFGAVVVFLSIAVSSSVVQARLAMVIHEISEYMVLTPEQRAVVTTSSGVRLQFYTSIWGVLNQSNWWIGVGSINFGSAFSAINYSLGTTTELASEYFANFQNPHNEYLFMLATKGVVGLILYISIFAQACRIAMLKQDGTQRLGLLMFVFLFMLSITFNSMMIDMEEGHFTMIILLIFLAPRALNISIGSTTKLKNSHEGLVQSL
jgi:O-antigen ligase